MNNQMDFNGFDPWLATFLVQAAEETHTLRKHGAEDLARARGILIRDLIESAAEHYDEFVDTKEAAEMLGCSEETVRRKVRSGLLPDHRGSPRENIRLRRREVNEVSVEPPNPSSYDVDADVEEVLGQL